MNNNRDFELVYFNLDGRALPIRLLFHFSRTPFTDTRIGRSEWPELKKKTPWGFLPVLRQDGRTFFDSVAIAVHVARSVGLWPEEAGDQTRSLAIMNAVEDVMTSLQRVSQGSNPLIKLWRIKKVIRRDLPEICGKFEAQLEGNFFFGEEISAADLSVFSLLYLVMERAGRYGSTAVVSSFEGLYGFYERVAHLPAVASYLSD